MLMLLKRTTEVLQFFAQLAGLPFGEGIEERVECGAVVHFFRMGKFVEYHVVGKCAGKSIR